jgi:nitrite reductase/ring-hydroxylating ferredoxin subunit
MLSEVKLTSSTPLMWTLTAYDLQTGDSLFGPPRRPLTRINLELRPGGEVWAVGKG